jgi:hypothetical protein
MLLVAPTRKSASSVWSRWTKRISDQPQLADFAALHLPDEDLTALRTCKVGDCDIKLSEEALERGALKATKATLETGREEGNENVRDRLRRHRRLGADACSGAGRRDRVDSD